MFKVRFSSGAAQLKRDLFEKAELQTVRREAPVRPQLLQHPNVMSVLPNTPQQRLMLDSLLSEIKRQGIYSAPLMVPLESQQSVYDNWSAHDRADDPSLSAVIQSRQPHMTRQTFAQKLASLKTWIRSGVKFVIGTDQGPEASELGPVVWGRMGRRHFEIMEGLQEAGMSSMDILIAATRHGAEAYGLSKQSRILCPATLSLSQRKSVCKKQRNVC